jgi:hypothetical protein
MDFGETASHEAVFFFCAHVEVHRLLVALAAKVIEQRCHLLHLLTAEMALPCAQSGVAICRQLGAKRTTSGHRKSVVSSALWLFQNFFLSLGWLVTIASESGRCTMVVGTHCLLKCVDHGRVRTIIDTDRTHL